MKLLYFDVNRMYTLEISGTFTGPVVLFYLGTAP